MGRPFRRAGALLLTLLLGAGCAPRAPTAATAAAGAGPRTRAERSGYAETSRHGDVLAFVDSLVRQAPAVVATGTMGRTGEGRAIPYLVAARPLVRTPAEARALGRPVVYVQGNIHAGEVEGKEALLALVRDLARAPAPNVLDSIVLVAVPIYNGDGNERVGPQERNRGEQNGPALVGERANAAGLDLNRDYVKAEAPETRASLGMFARWDPELFVDLHTTDGSYHGYALTYAPSLAPAAPLGPYTRDTLLPELRRRVRARHGLETFDYGNFSREYGADVTPDTVKQGWFSYDHRPRFGTNYYGLRGRVAVLGEAYSHDPFERRVRATYAFVRELLSLAAERGAGEPPRPAAPGSPVAVRAELTRAPYVGAVVAEDLARAGDSAHTEPGVPRGLRRTGRYRAVRIPVHDRFTPTLARPLAAAYLLAPGDSAAVRLLRLHGLTVDRVVAPVRLQVRAFVVDSVARAARPFQGHRETRLAGRWIERRHQLVAGALVVRTAQPLGRLAAYLLEPESDDGLVTWNVFDASLRAGAEFPVLAAPRVPEAP